MTTQNTFRQVIAPLTVKYREVVEGGRLRIYYNCLCKYSELELMRAVHKCEERCKHFPSIQELEEACK